VVKAAPPTVRANRSGALLGRTATPVPAAGLVTCTVGAEWWPTTASYSLLMERTRRTTRCHSPGCGCTT
jgi:hypothetical protein